jgi:hypothetical protein
MVTVLIVIGIFWVVSFKTRNYFVIFYYTRRLPQIIYVHTIAIKKFRTLMPSCCHTYILKRPLCINNLNFNCVNFENVNVRFTEKIFKKF